MTYQTSNTVKNNGMLIKIVSGIGAIWYVFGLLQFWLAVNMDTGAAIQSGEITAAHGAAIDQTPALIWAFFAVASGAGLIGTILLFRQSTMAKTAFLISFISAAIYFAWVYIFSGTGSDRPQEEIYIAATVLTVTLAYLLFSRRKIG